MARTFFGGGGSDGPPDDDPPDDDSSSASRDVDMASGRRRAVREAQRRARQQPQARPSPEPEPRPTPTPQQQPSTPASGGPALEPEQSGTDDPFQDARDQTTDQVASPDPEPQSEPSPPQDAEPEQSGPEPAGLEPDEADVTGLYSGEVERIIEENPYVDTADDVRIVREGTGDTARFFAELRGDARTEAIEDQQQQTRRTLEGLGVGAGSLARTGGTDPAADAQDAARRDLEDTVENIAGGGLAETGGTDPAAQIQGPSTAELEEAEREAETESFTAVVPEWVPVAGGRETTIEGRVRDVEPQRRDDGSIVFVEEGGERFSDYDWSFGFGGEGDEVESGLADASDWLNQKASTGATILTGVPTQEYIEPRDPGKFPEMTASGDLEETYVLTPRKQPQPEAEPLELSGGERFAHSAVESALAIPALAVDTARGGLELAELGGGAVRGEYDPGELPGAAAGAAAGGLNYADTNPYRFGGMVAGSLVGSAGLFKVASKVGPRASLGTRLAIQPGEEALGYGGAAATRGAGKAIRRPEAGQRAADTFFPNNEPIFFSEEAAIRGTQRVVGAVRARRRASLERFQDTQGTTSSQVFGRPTQTYVDIESDPSTSSQVFGRPMSTEFRTVPEPSETGSRDVFGRPVSTDRGFSSIEQRAGRALVEGGRPSQRTVFATEEGAFIERNPGATPLATEFSGNVDRWRNRVRGAAQRARYRRPPRQDEPTITDQDLESGDVVFIEGAIETELEADDPSRLRRDLERDQPDTDTDADDIPERGPQGPRGPLDTRRTGTGTDRVRSEMDVRDRGTGQVAVARERGIETELERENAGRIETERQDPSVRVQPALPPGERLAQPQQVGQPTRFDALEGPAERLEPLEPTRTRTEPGTDLEFESWRELELEQEQRRELEFELEFEWEGEFESELELELEGDRRRSGGDRGRRRGGFRETEFILEAPLATGAEYAENIERGLDALEADTAGFRDLEKGL